MKNEMKALYKKLIKQKNDLSKVEMFFILLFQDLQRNQSSEKFKEKTVELIEKDKKKGELKSNKEKVLQDKISDRELKHKEKMELKHEEIEIQKKKLELMNPAHIIEAEVKKVQPHIAIYKKLKVNFEKLANSYFKVKQ